MPLSPGSRLGPYEIVGPIGAGGMGEVYRAKDTRLGRIVAIKVVGSQFSRRFEGEARAIAALNHPHICTLHDIGADYLVMEYVEGKRLCGPLDLEEALRLGVQIAGALEEAHRKGVIHRDLKPANIMVTASGSVKLLDFGLAKLAAGDDGDVTRTMEGTVVGTAAYMAPEQAEGKPLDERSDVFSFGAVLYEMLSGSRAFGGSSTAQVLSAVLRDDPPPLQAPPSVERIVKRCLAKQPAQRFQTMAEVKASLEQVSVKPAQSLASIAVLPFANLSPDKENEYFSDGLTEEIINALAHIPSLKVTARTSAFAFRGKEQDIRKIAEMLNVRTILEGSVRRAGSRIRVTAQLINAEDGYHLWSERYDRELADVFAIQDEIARAIAAALQVKLSGRPAPLRNRAPNLPAYEAYLKARYHMAKFTPEAIVRAKEYFEEAVGLDTECALAHSYLARCLCLFAGFGLLPAAEAMPLARVAAQKALAIDPSLPEAHSVLGIVATAYDYDWSEGDRQFQLAIASEPTPPDVLCNYGLFYLLPMDRPRDAAEQYRRALEQDPLRVLSRVEMAWCLRAAGMEAEALDQLRQALELDENFFPTWGALALEHASRGRFAEALAFAERAYSLAPRLTNAIGLLAGLLVRTGDTTRPQALLDKLGSGQAYGAPYGLVLYHVVCSEIEKAADWAEKAIAQRDFRLILGMRQPLVNDLRSSVRWPALARQMNLPNTD